LKLETTVLIGQIVKYLVVVVTTKNEGSTEIQARIAAGNDCCFALQRILKSKSTSRKAKLAICKKVIKPVVTYANETWVLTKKDEALISTCERKVLRKIFGPVNERNVWRIRSNQELRCMYQDLDLVTTIRKSRLKWLGHVHRMSSQRGPKMALEGNPGGRRRKGRSRKRWLDDVQDDMIKMGVKRWRTKAMARGGWRKICVAAKVLQEL
jgi:hypothetical protein